MLGVELENERVTHWPGVAMGLVGPKVLLVLLLFAAGLAYAEKNHRRHGRDEGKDDTVLAFMKRVSIWREPVFDL